MITLLERGLYKLVETKRHTKIIYLGHRAYAWLDLDYLSEIVLITHKIHKTDYFLSTGHYRIYQVRDEPNLHDHTYLSLEAGPRKWQGYLLLSELPDGETRLRGRIMPTTEKIIAGDGHHTGTVHID